MDLVAGVIAKANRRLDRARIPDRFTVVEDRRWDDPKQYGRTWVDFHLSYPVISFGGWQFLGTVDPLVDADSSDRSYTARLVPGLPDDVLGDHVITGMDCDHCHMTRDRANVFLVKHQETGEVKQVGSTCLSLFTGVEVTGLWALQYDPREDLEDLGEDGFESYGGGGPDQFTRDEVILAALIVTNGGRDYRRAEWDGSGTGRDVRTLLAHGWDVRTLLAHGWDYLYQDVPEHQRPTRRDYLADGTVAAVVAAMAAAPGSDRYVQQMHEFATHNWVIPDKLIGVVASAVTVYNRSVERAARAAAPKPEGWFGTPGESYKGVQATLRRAKYIGRGYGYHDPDRYLYTLVTTGDTPHVLVWWADELEDSWDIGDTLQMDFKVKSHDTYQPHHYDDDAGKRVDGTPQDQTTIFFVRSKTLRNLSLEARMTPTVTPETTVDLPVPGDGILDWGETYPFTPGDLVDEATPHVTPRPVTSVGLGIG